MSASDVISGRKKASAIAGSSVDWNGGGVQVANRVASRQDPGGPFAVPGLQLTGAGVGQGCVVDRELPGLTGYGKRQQNERAEMGSQSRGKPDMLKKVLIGVGALLPALVVIVGGTLLWLYATAPGPREAEGWELGPPLPNARGELATAIAHAGPCPLPPCPELERMLVLGGLAGLGRAQDRVSIYDPTGHEWRAGPPLPRPRHHLGAAGLGRSVYVSGGAEGVGRPWMPESDLWRLEVDGSAWEPLEPMPEPRWGHRMVAYDGQLYVVGGQGPTARVLIYAPGVGWAAGAEMPVPRDHLSAVVVDGRIWAIGGRVPESLARVDIYDPAADRWLDGPDLPAATSGAAEGAVDGMIMVFGGEDMNLRGGEVYDRHWMLDTRAGEPRWLPAPAPPLPVHGADGAVFQGTMVIVGGASRHGALSVTAWTDLTQRLEPGALMAASGRR